MHSAGRRIILVIMISVIWSLTNVSAQIPTVSQASAKISGKVLGADGKPVAGAVVTLRGSGREAKRDSNTTDESGTFTFSNLAPGDYFLSASKGAYVYQGFTSKDQANPTETAPIRIERGSESVAVTIVLQKGGVITGKITDERGDPVVGANV